MHLSSSHGEEAYCNLRCDVRRPRGPHFKLMLGGDWVPLAGMAHLRNRKVVMTSPDQFSGKNFFEGPFFAFYINF